MGVDFTSIDFETANHQRGSACAVGMARVRDDVVVETKAWLMRPPQTLSDFHPYNVGIHGITSASLVSALTFRDSLPQILEFIGDDVICAHNARFDASVLYAAATAEGIRIPTLQYRCTLRATRHHLALPSYRLPFVAAALRLAPHTHHNAAADALAVALIVPPLLRHIGGADLDDLLVEPPPSTWRPAPLPTAAGPAADADPEHPLWGRVIVFTGALSTMTRHMAHEECIQVGGMPEPNVTKRTNVLVVGELDPARLVPGDVTSQKAQKAFKLQAGGQPIEVMTEHDFLRQL